MSSDSWILRLANKCQTCFLKFIIEKHWVPRFESIISFWFASFWFALNSPIKTLGPKLQAQLLTLQVMDLNMGGQRLNIGSPQLLVDFFGEIDWLELLAPHPKNVIKFMGYKVWVPSFQKQVQHMYPLKIRTKVQVHFCCHKLIH